MPEHRLQKTRAAYRPSPDSTVDWVAGERGASYVSCPNHCGRLVPDAVHGVSVELQPCARCRNIAASRLAQARNGHIDNAEHAE
jgi:hypothetical protein